METFHDSNTYRHGRSYRGRIQLKRVPLNSGGYTRGGQYFGRGAPLFLYYSADEVEPANAYSTHDGYFEGYVRGADREAAIAKLRTAFVQARFPGDRAPKKAAAKPNARRSAAKRNASAPTRSLWRRYVHEAEEMFTLPNGVWGYGMYAPDEADGEQMFTLHVPGRRGDVDDAGLVREIERHLGPLSSVRRLGGAPVVDGEYVLQAYEGRPGPGASKPKRRAAAKARRRPAKPNGRQTSRALADGIVRDARGARSRVAAERAHLAYETARREMTTADAFRALSAVEAAERRVRPRR